MDSTTPHPMACPSSNHLGHMVLFPMGGFDDGQFSKRLPKPKGFLVITRADGGGSILPIPRHHGRRGEQHEGGQGGDHPISARHYSPVARLHRSECSRSYFLFRSAS